LSGYSWIACFAIHHLAMYLAFVYLFGHFSLSHTFRYLYIVVLESWSTYDEC
jgi:hypothetical protein